MKNLLISNLSKDHFIFVGEAVSGKTPKQIPTKLLQKVVIKEPCMKYFKSQKIITEANFPTLPSKVKWSIQTIKVLVFQNKHYFCGFTGKLKHAFRQSHNCTAPFHFYFK